MFWAGLLLIIRRINSVLTAIGKVMRYVDWLLAGSRWNWFFVVLMMEYWSVIRWDVMYCISCWSAGTWGCARLCVARLHLSVSALSSITSLLVNCGTLLWLRMCCIALLSSVCRFLPAVHAAAVDDSDAPAAGFDCGCCCCCRGTKPLAWQGQASDLVKSCCRSVTVINCCSIYTRKRPANTW